MTGPTADDRRTTELPAVYRRNVRVAIACGVGLVLLTLVPTVLGLASGRGVTPQLLGLWAVPLVGFVLGWWALRRQRRILREDPRAFTRRALDKRAQRVYLIGGPVAYVVGNVGSHALGLDGPARWAALLGLMAVMFVPLHLLAKRFDPRARLWGAPPPLSDEELARRDAEQEAEKKAAPASVTKPW
jgi:hypothetical protein